MMLDIGWSELLLIGVVALVVIGPKELPSAMRALGQMARKVRRMAGEFRGQFNEALREADLEDVKREFDTLRQATADLRRPFDPSRFLENEIKSSEERLAAEPSIPPPASNAAEAARPAEPIPSAFAPAAVFREGPGR